MVDLDPQSPSFWDEHGARIVGLIVFGLALAGQPDDPVPGMLLREGTFLSLGVGFASGLGAMFGHLPEPSPVGWLAPGYAAVLSVLMRMWPAMPDGFALIQLFNSLCLGAGAWGLCAWARALAFPNHFIDGGVGLVVVTPAVLGLSAVAVPEPMFAMLMVAAVIAARHGAGDGRVAALAGAFAGLAAASHGLGWAAVAGSLAGVAAGGRRMVLAFLPAAAVFVIPMVWWSVSAAPTDLGVMTLSAAASAEPRVSSLAVVSGAWWNSSDVMALVGVVVGLAFFARGAAALWGVDRGAAVTVVAVVVIAFAWPTAPAAWPIISSPFVAFGAIIGARRVWGSDRRFRVPVLLLVAVWVAVLFAGATRAVVQPDPEVARRRQILHTALTSMQKELPADAIIASDADVMVFMHTDRRTVPLSDGASMNTLCERGVTHLAVTRTADLPEAFASARADSVLLREFDLTDGPSLYRLACR